MPACNFWIEINGDSIHLGKYVNNWKFIWNIRSILQGVLTHLTLASVRKEDVKNTLKVFEFLEKGFEIDFYDTLQLRDNVNFHLITSGVSETWLKSHSFLFKPIDSWKSDECLPNFGMRIPIKHINSGLILYWVSKLFEQGVLVSDEMTEDLTWDNFISKVTTSKGEDFCSFGKYNRGNYSIYWNYVVGDLCCAPVDFDKRD